MDLAFAAGVADEDELSDRVFLATLRHLAIGPTLVGHPSSSRVLYREPGGRRSAIARKRAFERAPWEVASVPGGLVSPCLLLRWCLRLAPSCGRATRLARRLLAAGAEDRLRAMRVVLVVRAPIGRQPRLRAVGLLARTDSNLPLWVYFLSGVPSIDLHC